MALKIREQAYKADQGEGIYSVSLLEPQHKSFRTFRKTQRRSAALGTLGA